MTKDERYKHRGKMRIQDMQIGQRLANVLYNQDIRDLDWEKLRSLSDSDLLSYKNLGRGGLRELDECLFDIDRPRYAILKAQRARDSKRRKAKISMTKDEKTLRRLLWLHHGCPPHTLYGDDGEMQCNNPTCMIDFKRMAPDEIQDNWTRRGQALLEKAGGMEAVYDEIGSGTGRTVAVKTVSNELRIQDLAIGRRLANILRYYDVQDRDWEKLLSLKDSELLSYKNLGWKSLMELDKSLSEIGLARYSVAKALEDCTCCKCDCGICRGCNERACASCNSNEDSP